MLRMVPPPRTGEGWGAILYRRWLCRKAPPKPSPTRGEEGAAQIEKLVPQPQEAVAWGFFTWKDWPMRSSTKSISEPSM
jgi:hypothetical protein